MRATYTVLKYLGRYLGSLFVYLVPSKRWFWTVVPPRRGDIQVLKTCFPMARVLLELGPPRDFSGAFQIGWQSDANKCNRRNDA